MSADSPSTRSAKEEVRAALSAARRARSADQREAGRTANAGHLRSALRGLSVIAAYLPLPTEPLDRLLLDELCRDTRLLLPVVTGAAPLDWCEHPAPTRPGALGIDEPAGARLGPAAIGQADAVLVPALAVDAAGFRLGRGGGHYDRTLELRTRLLGPGHPDLLIAVLYDGEYPLTVPFGPLDHRVTAVVTPRGGVQPIAREPIA